MPRCVAHARARTWPTTITDSRPHILSDIEEHYSARAVMRCVRTQVRARTPSHRNTVRCAQRKLGAMHQADVGDCQNYSTE